MEGSAEERKSVFCMERDASLADKHFLMEFWDAKNIYNLQVVKNLLKETLDKSAGGGRVPLRITLRDFRRSGCISGIAVTSCFCLTVYIRPDLSHAAIDIFPRGDFSVNDLAEALKQAFGSGKADFYMLEGRGLKRKTNLNKVYIDNKAVQETKFGGRLYPDFDAGPSVFPTMSM